MVRNVRSLPAGETREAAPEIGPETQIAVRFTDDDDQKLAEMVRRIEWNKTDFIRHAIRHYYRTVAAVEFRVDSRGEPIEPPERDDGVRPHQLPSSRARSLPT
jgi:hypothetical protein